MQHSLSSSTNLMFIMPSEDSEVECNEENVVIDEITESEPTSVILRFCKKEFLRPFVCILGLVGLRPNAVDRDLATLLGHLQSITVLALLLAGYVLQYLSGFRRDRGFLDPEQQLTYGGGHQSSRPAAPPTNSTTQPTAAITKTMLVNTGEMIFIYIIPALLHLGGFVMAAYIYRFADNEQLQCLIERVFILCSKPRRLVATLWVYFGLGTLWLAGSVVYIGMLVLQPATTLTNPTTAKLPPLLDDVLGPDYTRGLLCVALLFHDLVQMVVIVSYSLMCFLLRCYLRGLKAKLLLHTIEPLNWMREICEFRKLLHHLNTRISLPVACLTLLNLSYTLSSVTHLVQDINACPIRVFSFTIANVLLWMVISLTPFFQAASLTVTCRQTQSCGHLISIRPFVHRNTSSEELNTVLLYASSLQMSAQLFRVPINAHYLCFLVLVCVIALLTFGMCLSLALGG